MSHGPAVSSIDPEGTRWHVHDVAFGPPLAAPGRKRVVSLESPEANHRYFVSADGIARASHFTRKKPRSLSADVLEQQFNGAGFVSMSPRDVGATTPT